MNRLTHYQMNKMMNEHVRRMGEPEPYRSLRLQKKRLQHERQRQAEKRAYDAEAEQLRREIRELGGSPCA